MIVAVKQQERRGREWARKEEAKQLAALRSPSKPPHCTDSTEVAKLRLAGGKLADVRIFRFDETVYYIPSAWLQLATPTYGVGGNIDKLNLGRFDPDVHAVECPGVIHHITGGGLYLTRYAGIGFKPHIGEQGSTVAGAAFFYAEKLRPPFELDVAHYQRDGLLASMDHRTLDAYVRVAPDVGVRRSWHPAHITKHAWAAQFQKWSAGPLLRVSPKPWEASLRTKEFEELTSAVRRLHIWLSLPPNRRRSEPPI